MSWIKGAMVDQENGRAQVAVFFLSQAAGDADLAISRQIGVVATHTFELRLEAFNLLNTFNWATPAPRRHLGDSSRTFNSGQFGRITTQAGAPQIIQLGMKYGF